MKPNGACVWIITLLLGAAAHAQPYDQPADTTSSEPEYESTYYEEYDYSSLITNIFYESDVIDALRDISVQAGVPIVADPSVKGWVTLEVVDLPLEETLRRMLFPMGYTFRKMDGYYLVGAAYPENPSFPLLSMTRRIKPSYLRAKEVPLLLSPFYEPFIKVDEQANVIVVSASPEVIDRLMEDLAVIDVPPKQVMIEALVTEISTNAMKQIGIDWKVIGSGPGYDLLLGQMVAGLGDSTLKFEYSRDGITQHGNMTVNFAGAIKALAESGKLKIHANPKLVTLDGQPAQIFLGREEYYEILTGPETYLYTRLEVIKVGITLAIRPFVADNGDITVEIQPEVSDVMGAGFTENLPVVLKRNVNTEIRVKDGETITIGGLVSKTESLRETKVPFLGDIPILGYLFKSTQPETDESEIVIFITPRVLKD